MNAIKRSWELFKTTWGILRQDKELILFPIISSILAMILALVVFLPGMLFVSVVSAAGSSVVTTITSVVVLFVYYLIVNTVTNFFSTGLVAAAFIRLDGGDPTFGDGIRIARTRIGTILSFSAIAATVGVVLNMLRNSDNVLVRGLVAGLAGAAWNVVTFLVIPVIAAKEIGATDAIKESGSLLRKTWGEQIAGSFGIGLIMGIPIVLVILLSISAVVLAVAVSAPIGVFIAIVLIAIFVIVTLAIISSTLNTIYKAAVYRYAATGDVVESFDADLITGAFKLKAS